MNGHQAELDIAVADFLELQDVDPERTPTAFSRRLPRELRSEFLSACEEIAAADGVLERPVDSVPDVVGGYRILHSLGRGGMGIVFEAVDPTSGEHVAVKVLHPAMALDPRMVARFRREAGAVSLIRHPNIVEIRDRGTDRGSPFLVMELCAGRPLAKLIKANRAPSHPDHGRARKLFADRRRLLGAFAKVADALAAAHAQGFVHRDVKPGNLMVDDSGAMTVLDFGLARSLAGESSSLTRTAEFFGTPMYVAPEQVAGAARVDGRADVYALGAVLYECLTGEPPFAASELGSMLKQVQHGSPVSAALLQPDLPQSVVVVLERAMAKDPEQRYRSAEDMADDLRNLARGAAVRVRGRWRARLRSGVRQLGRRLSSRASLPAAALIALGGIAFGCLESAACREAEKQRDLQAVADALALDWCARYGRGVALPAAEELSPRARRAFDRAASLLAVSNPEAVPALLSLRQELRAAAR